MFFLVVVLVAWSFLRKRDRGRNAVDCRPELRRWPRGGWGRCWEDTDHDEGRQGAGAAAPLSGCERGVTPARLAGTLVRVPLTKDNTWTSLPRGPPGTG